MLKKAIAVLLATTLVASSSIVVWAETINEDVSETVSASGDDNITVNGDIEFEVTDTSPDFAGVRANGGSTVTVNGDISITNKMGEGEGIACNGDSTVTVNGDVSAPSTGILSDDGGTISVNPSNDGKKEGNVTGGIFVSDATVSVSGNVEKTNTTDWIPAAITESGDSTIMVGGDVKSSGSVIKTDGDSLIVIEGSLTASASNPVIILDQTTSVVDTETYEETFSKNEGAKVSTIVVHEIKGDLSKDSNLVKSGYRSGAKNYETGEEPKWVDDTKSGAEQIKNIFYIIKKAEGSSDGISSLSGTTQKAGYDTATENTVITVKVKEGYGLSAGSIKVTSNADGSYTLTVPRGGGVTLTAEALKKAVDEIEEKEKEEEKKEQKQEDQQQEQQKVENKKDEKKSDDSSSDSSSNNTANSAPAVSPFVAYAPILTIGGGQAVTFSGATFGADTGIKMEEPGPIAEAAFATAMPAGFTKGFSFSITNGGQTSYALKNGKISFTIPAQYLLAGRQFKLIGVDKDGNAKVFDNESTEDGCFEADIDIEGYQFELVYKD